MSELFAYKVRDRAGRVIAGSIEADSQETAARRLRQEGYFIVQLGAKSRTSTSWLTMNLTAPAKLNSKALAIFAKQFAIMSKTGLPIVTCLELLANNTINRDLKEALVRARRSVAGGNSLADALGNESIFPPMFINMIAAGEFAGTMEEVLTQMSNYYERQSKMQKQIQQATMYPSVVLAFAFLMVFIVLFVVLPRFAGIYQQFGAELPLFTQVVLSIRDWFVEFWYVPLALILLLFILVKRYYATEVGRQRIDGLLLRLPLIGGILSRVTLTGFCRALSLMLRSGISMVDSLEVTARVVSNKSVVADIIRAKEGVRQGQGLAISFRDARTFPVLVKQMIEVGEETGDLTSTLEYLAEFYDDEIEYLVANLTALLEPFMIFVVAVIVAIIAFSIVLPMFRMSSFG